jgi:hypothetical protein
VEREKQRIAMSVNSCEHDTFSDPLTHEGRTG